MDATAPRKHSDELNTSATATERTSMSAISSACSP